MRFRDRAEANYCVERGRPCRRGRAFGELDPQDPANAQIVDLKLAPRNANGKVEYVSVFELTKPVEMSRATGLLWYDLVNRGGPLRSEKGVIQPWTYGHVHLVSGWQGDLVPTDTNVTVQVPVAKNADGSPITGVVLSRLAYSKPETLKGRRSLSGRKVKG